MHERVTRKILTSDSDNEIEGTTVVFYQILFLLVELRNKIYKRKH